MREVVMAPLPLFSGGGELVFAVPLMIVPPSMQREGERRVHIRGDLPPRNSSEDLSLC